MRDPVSNGTVLHVVAPLPSLLRRTRLAKLMGFMAQRSRWRVHHAGWSREPGDFSDPGLSVHKKCLVRGGGYGSRKARLLYLVWMLRVFFYCLSVRRDEVVWALGFESAFPAAMAKRFRKFDLVFDDADRFAMLFAWPIPVRAILIRLERWTSRASSFHMVPSLSRYDYDSPTFFVLENVPDKRAFERAKARASQLPKVAEGKLVLNINGWLGRGRGMAVALDALRKVPPERLHVLLIGKLDCEDASSIAKLPNVTAMGEIEYSECLAWFFHSDFVFTFYSPHNPINLNAQSNKWGDALRAGAGILVNREVRKAAELERGGAAYTLDYDDADGLAAFLNACAEDPAMVAPFRRAAVEMGQRMPFFDDYLAEVFWKMEACHAAAT